MPICSNLIPVAALDSAALQARQPRKLGAPYFWPVSLCRPDARVTESPAIGSTVLCEGLPPAAVS
jgi:hypothetical protein